MGKSKAKVKVEFGTPPPQRRDLGWAEIADQLRAAPGEWAVVHRDLPASVQWAVNAGKVDAVAPERGFSTRSAGNWRDGSGKQWIEELWMVYERDQDDYAPAKVARRNGGKK